MSKMDNWGLFKRKDAPGVKAANLRVDACNFIKLHFVFEIRLILNVKNLIEAQKPSI